MNFVVVSPGDELQNLPHDVEHAHVRTANTAEDECYYRFAYNPNRKTGGWVSSRATIGAGVELSPEVVIGSWVRIENSVLRGRISMYGTKDHWTTVHNSTIEGDYSFFGPYSFDGEEQSNAGPRKSIISGGGGSLVIGDHEEPASTGAPPWQ